jgi:hypothetical protein
MAKTIVLKVTGDDRVFMVNQIGRASCRERVS